MQKLVFHWWGQGGRTSQHGILTSISIRKNMWQLFVLNDFSPSTDDSTPSPPFEKCFSLNSYSSLEVVNHTLWPLLLRWASRRSPWKIWHRAKTMLTRILSLCFFFFLRFKMYYFLFLFFLNFKILNSYMRLNADVRKENLSLSYRVALLKWLKIWVICSLSSLPTRCIKKSMCNKRK